MTETEKAYIAGIIDGEGSIMLERFHSNQLPSPCISITSSTLELLEYVKTVLGKGSIKSKKNYKIDVHKNCYTYILRYNNALNLLNDIYPYLIINSKRKRAKLIIDNYKKLTPRNGRYTEEMLKNKIEFYNKFINTK